MSGFQRSSILVILSTTFLVLFFITWIAVGLLEKVRQSSEKEEYAQMKSLIKTDLEASEEKALARAELIASISDVQTLFATRNRKGLLDYCKNFFAIQKEKYGVDQAQFHLPPATSFLRLNAPDKFGDDLSSFRPMVVSVNKDQNLRRGLSIARSGPAIFGVVPVKDTSGKFIGSFEVGLKFETMLDNLKTAYGLEATLFLEEALLKEICTGLDGEVFNEQNRVGKYLKYHSTDWSLMKNLVNSGDLAGLDERDEYGREALDAPFGVVIIPLRNAAGTPIGIIVAARSLAERQSLFARYVLIMVGATVFVFILMAGVILVVLRGGMVRPLRTLVTHFKSLADGDTALEITDTKGYYKELEELAEQYERLRQKETPNNLNKN